MFLVMKWVLSVLCHEPMMIKYPIHGYSVYMEVANFVLLN
jgi:hypothetical protein